MPKAPVSSKMVDYAQSKHKIRTQNTYIKKI